MVLTRSASREVGHVKVKKEPGTEASNGDSLPGRRPSAKQVTELKRKLAEERAKITLLQSPLQTLTLICKVVGSNFVYFTNLMLTSQAFWALVALAGAGYGFLRGTENPLADDVDRAVLFTVWWVGLGVLSSVGLGSGVHSGLLFLFPHIFAVVAASKRCPSMDFVSSDHMWWRESPMECGTGGVQGREVAPFAEVFLRVFPAAFLWGTGTAMGEIPPYALSRAAALSGKVDEEFEEMMGEADGTDVLSKMKAWMISFVESYGFIGIFLMSAWPNAAFDLVGICCGQLNVTFMTFFVATWMGKACVKVTGQIVFFVFWFRNTELVLEYAVELVRKLPSWVPLTPESVDKKIKETLQQMSTGQDKEGNPSLMKQLADLVIGGVILCFVYTTVNQLAQQRQKSVDNEIIEKYEKGQSKKNL